VGGTCLTEAQAFNDTYGNFTYVGTGPTDPFCEEYNICDIGNYQFLMPQTIPKLVGAHDLWNGTGTVGGLPDTGQGITVAVIEDGCMDAQTLQNYSRQLWGDPNQVTSRFTQIALSGDDPFTGEYGQQTTLSECLENATITGWEGETALDIEYIAAMAPGAHIDLVGLPYDSFDDFDQAYQFIAANLSTGSPCPASFGTVANFVGTANDTGACSVTIDSNSYGSGEAYVAFEAVPIYLDAENQLLTIMSLEGITNFFASGDYTGGGTAWGIVQAGMPSIATGAISVGGGQLTAMAPNGQAFEDTEYYAPMCEDWEVTGCLENLTVNVTPTAGIYSYTYWAAYCEDGALYCGYVGAGHGPSETLATPWWENANDTYTSGVKVDPEISNAAAFNMTIWAPVTSTEDGWEPTYGGTSFACPISAAEWVLVEEQAKAAGDVYRFGDINALLFGLHNAQEANVSYAMTTNSPFYPMGLSGTGASGFTTANWDSINWYLYNLSLIQSPGTNLPPWAFSADNPAGPLWNFLGGIGMMLAPQMAASVVGATRLTPSVMNSQMSIVEVSGLTNVPVTELSGGTAYNFAVVNSTTGIPIPDVEIWAYSGCANNGSYGGGATTIITSATGNFEYAPIYAGNSMHANYTEYAYFKAAVTPISPSSQWAFNAYAVIPPTPAGSLVLAVNTPIGTVTSGTAQVNSFSEFNMNGWFVEGSTAQVLLNGLPAPGAVVTQTSVNWNWSLSSQSGGSLINSTAWAPGTLVSNWIADSGGQVTYFDNGFTAEYDGVVPPQVFELQASYAGLTSAPVIVYVEPQFGLFEPNLSVNAAATKITGNLSFVNMKYVSSIVVSYGNAPGQNETFDCTTDISFCANQVTPGGMESSLMSGTLPISIDITGVAPPPTPLVVNMTGYGFNYNSYYEWMTQPLWNYAVTLSDNGPVPTADLSSTPVSGVVSGTVSLSYGGTWAIGATSLNGATGTLTEFWSGGSATLASGMSLVNNGTLTYVWNTSMTPVGYVTMTMSVMTPGGLTSSTSTNYYVAEPMITVMPGTPYVAEAVTFTAWSEGGSGLTYFWTFGDGTTSALAQPTHVFDTAGPYDVSVLVNNTAGLSVSETTVLNVLAQVPPTVTANPSTAFVGQSVAFSVSVPPGAPQPPLTYSWLFGDGASSTLAAPLHAYPNAGIYSVTVWENGTGAGLVAKTSMNVTAAPSPVITATPNPTAVGEMTYFSASVPADAPQGPLSYVWKFGDGSTSTSAAPGHAYSHVGTYTVTVWENGTVSGIEGTLAMTVGVAPTPVVSASLNPADAGQVITFSVSQPTGAPTAPLTYAWHFGDGKTSNAAAPPHSYASAGIFSVTVYENGTGGSGIVGTLKVTINPALSVSIAVSPASPAAGQSFTITTTVTGGTGALTYLYSIPTTLGCPANPAGAQVVCTPTASGDYSVAVIVSDASNTSVTQVVTVTVAQSSTTSSGSSFDWSIPVIAVLVVVAVLLGLLYLMERNKRLKAVTPAPQSNMAPPPPSTGGPARPPGY
jgi:subtilase family serine protease